MHGDPLPWVEKSPITITITLTCERLGSSTFHHCHRRSHKVNCHCNQLIVQKGNLGWSLGPCYFNLQQVLTYLFRDPNNTCLSVLESCRKWGYDSLKSDKATGMNSLTQCQLINNYKQSHSIRNAKYLRSAGEISSRSVSSPSRITKSKDTRMTFDSQHLVSISLPTAIHRKGLVAVLCFRGRYGDLGSSSPKYEIDLQGLPYTISPTGTLR